MCFWKKIFLIVRQSAAQILIKSIYPKYINQKTLVKKH